MNLNKLFVNFYTYVNKIILDIHSHEHIFKNLFYCNYRYLNSNTVRYYPLTICLGGAGYIQYKNIFEKKWYFY